MKVVEYKFVKINNNSCIFSKMAAKMAPEFESDISLSETKINGVYLYEVKDVELEY